jgi:hypothetical protein
MSISRISNSLARRLYSTSIGLDHEISKAKAFKDIPTISPIKFIARMLPGGKYHNASFLELVQNVRDEYGDIVKLPGMFGKPEAVVTYNASDFDKVNYEKFLNIKIIIIIKFRFLELKVSGLFALELKHWIIIEASRDQISIQNMVAWLHLKVKIGTA